MNGRLLDRVVADADDQVGAIDRLVHVVALGQCGGSHPQLGAAALGADAGDRALAHLGVEERNADAPDALGQQAGEPWPAAGGAEHYERTLGLHQQGCSVLDRSGGCHREFDRMDRNDLQIVRHGLAGNVFGQFEVHGAGALFGRQPERLSNDGRDARRADDLPRRLGQRLHRRDDVDDLEARLARRHDRLLSGDQHHRHGAEVGIRRTGDQVQRARTECGHADAGLPRQPAMRRRHERSRLLVSRDDQLDARLPQRFDDIEVFFARDGEDSRDAFVLECLDEQVGCFHGGSPDIHYWDRTPAWTGSPATSSAAVSTEPLIDSVQYSVVRPRPPKATLVSDMPTVLRITWTGSARWFSTQA